MKSPISRYSRLRNYLHALILLSGMLALLSLVGWLLAGPAGIAWFLLVGVFIFLAAPRLPPALILRLHSARVLRAEDAPRLYEILIWLCQQAGMKNTPTLYYIPSRLMNAFSTGLKENAVVAISDGMLRSLNPRELTGVLAHEISHIHSNDILVMQVADVISRLTSIMALTGYLLIWIYIPLFIFTDAKVPWVLLIVLMMAPSVSALMQLALSRSREFSADVEAARLTDDPLGLASALEKIDYYQGSWFEKIFIPYRRLREPSLLRTHPLMVDRVNRLKGLALQKESSAHPFDSRKKHDWVKFPAPDQSPRRRFFGLWY
jgi:heat shock protein HtpX